MRLFVKCWFTFFSRRRECFTRAGTWLKGSIMCNREYTPTHTHSHNIHTTSSCTTFPSSLSFFKTIINKSLFFFYASRQMWIKPAIWKKNLIKGKYIKTRNHVAMAILQLHGILSLVDSTLCAWWPVVSIMHTSCFIPHHGGSMFYMMDDLGCMAVYVCFVYVSVCVWASVPPVNGI